MIVLMLSSSVVFAQEANFKAKNLKDASSNELILKMKQGDASIQSVISAEKPVVLSQGEKEDLMKQEALAQKEALKQMTATAFETDPKGGTNPGGPTEFLFDTQFEWPLGHPTALSVGLETDGNYIYTCHWQHDTIYRHDMNGNYLGWFIIPTVNLMRDMAYNPNNGYFYGAAASTAVWEMDFTMGAEALVSTITAPTACRGIGFDNDNNYLFGNNWSSDIYIFDLGGVTQSFFTPSANSYYGFAYDNYTTGGPYIFGHGQPAVPSDEVLFQMNYPAGTETGITFDVEAAFGHTGLIAGGLAITPPGTFPAVAPGEWTIFGIAQNASLWGVELSDPNPCSMPVALTATGITDFTADLGWTETGTSTVWDIEFGFAGFAPTGTPTHAGVTNPYTMTGLTALTGYDFYVRADCGGTYSGWSGVYSFATTGGDCMWECVGVDSYGDGWNGASIDFVVNGGVVASWFGPATYGPESFFFPILDPSTVDIVWNPGSWDGEVTYQIFDNAGGLQFSDGPNPTGTTGLAGACVVITCPAPTGAFTNNITGTSARANWVAGGSEVLWNLEYGAAGFVQGTGTMVLGIPPPVLGNPYYDIIGLTAANSYDWYVQADCGGDQSTWVGPNNFTTPCATFSVPFSESFDVQADPPCWINTSSNPVANGLWEYGSQASNPAGWGASAVDDHTGNGGFFAWTDGSTPEVADITLISPYIDASGVTVPYLSFYVFSNNVDYPGDNVPLYVDFWDGAAWNAVTTYAADNADWVFVGLDLSAYTITGDVQFRFITDQIFPVNSAFYNDILIDDVWFGEMPTCPDPFGLGVANATATGLDLVWTSVSGLSNVEYGTTGFVQGTGILLASVTSPQTVALVSGTAYDFYVQDDCGGGDLSNWVGPYTFTYYAAPANDDCVTAEVVTGPYPSAVTGTTLGATIDCAGVLDWEAVWYEVDLPYAVNNMNVDYCGTLTDIPTIGIVYYFDCTDCAAYVIADDYLFQDCGVPGGITTAYMNFYNIPGPTTVRFPVYLGDQMDFLATFNVTEVAPTYTVSGTMTYTNGTPMDAVTVNLDDGSDAIIATDVTDAAGYFEFLDITDGNYTYQSSTTKMWGGLNVVDIIFMRIKLANNTPPVWDPIMSDLAGNVNIPTGLNVVDLLMMQLRAGNLTAPAWNADDWLFEPVPVTVAGGNLVQDVRSICGGDVNYSYVPAAQFPANDLCSNAEIVTGPYPAPTIDGTTLYSTNDCPVILDQNGDVWYAIDLPYAGNTLVLSYCGDALMNNGWIIGTNVQCSCDLVDYFYADSWVFAAPCVNDLTWNNIPGPTTFYYPVSTGDFQEHFVLDIDVVEFVIAPPPANDDCATAEVIGVVTDQAFSTVSATASGVQPSCGGSTTPPVDIWYVYTATANGTLDIDLCGSLYDTRLTVWDGCAGTELACNDDSCGLQSAVSIAVTNGTSYYIQVGGYTTGSGDGDITTLFTP